ncbi:MAG: hypothetical protein AAGH76_06890 [Pseudomonadota bacterium]
MMAPASAVTDLFDRYASAWAANDPAALAACWQHSATLFYKAEEFENFFYSLDEVVQYWEHNVRFHDKVRLAFTDIQTLGHGDPQTITILRMRWDIRFNAHATNVDGSPFASAGKAMGGDNHVLAHLITTPDGMKFTGWCETPDAPISYMRRLYESQAQI